MNLRILLGRYLCLISPFGTSWNLAFHPRDDYLHSPSFVVIFPQMAATFVSSPDLLCSVESSIRGSRREFAALVSGVRVSVSGGSWRPGFVCVASSKQKKKGKEKRKTGGAGGGRRRSHGWSFDALMLVWDEVFDRCCADGGRAAAIRTLGMKGLQRYAAECLPSCRLIVPRVQL